MADFFTKNTSRFTGNDVAALWDDASYLWDDLIASWDAIDRSAGFYSKNNSSFADPA